MDGTLINSNHAIAISVNNVRKSLKLDALNEREIITTINDPAKNSINEFFGTAKTYDELKKEFFRRVIFNYVIYARKFDGIFWLISECRRAGYGLAVASNSPQKGLKRILFAKGLLWKFDLIVGSSDQIRQKPYPDMLNFIASSAKVDGNCVFIGDSDKDALAARAANMAFIGAKWNIYADLRDDICKFYANDTKMAFEIIKKILD